MDKLGTGGRTYPGIGVVLFLPAIISIASYSPRRVWRRCSMALLDDPKLLLKTPTPPPAGVGHLETTNLLTIRVPSYEHSQHQTTRDRQTADAGSL